MIFRVIDCPICGNSFDPSSAALSCQSCPINQGCQLVCCPRCGYSTVDPGRSRLLQLLLKIRGLRSFFRRGGDRSTLAEASDRASMVHNACTLAEIPPGNGSRVVGFHGAIPKERLSQLQAYGLIPGKDVRVLQSRPVMVVEVDHTELAMEPDLASKIRVTRIANGNFIPPFEG